MVLGWWLSWDLGEKSEGGVQNEQFGRDVKLLVQWELIILAYDHLQAIVSYHKVGKPTRGLANKER